MGNVTPFMVHTETMRELSLIFDPRSLDGNQDTSTYEFFLYYAYLVRSNRVVLLYDKTMPAPGTIIINKGPRVC